MDFSCPTSFDHRCIQESKGKSQTTSAKEATQNGGLKVSKVGRLTVVHAPAFVPVMKIILFDVWAGLTKGQRAMRRSTADV